MWHFTSCCTCWTPYSSSNWVFLKVPNISFDSPRCLFRSASVSKPRTVWCLGYSALAKANRPKNRTPARCCSRGCSGQSFCSVPLKQYPCFGSMMILVEHIVLTQKMQVSPSGVPLTYCNFGSCLLPIGLLWLFTDMGARTAELGGSPAWLLMLVARTSNCSFLLLWPLLLRFYLFLMVLLGYSCIFGSGCFLVKSRRSRPPG